MCFDFLIQGLLGNNFVSLKWKHMCIALTTLIPTPMVMKGVFGKPKKTASQAVFYFYFWCKKTRFFFDCHIFWMDG